MPQILKPDTSPLKSGPNDQIIMPPDEIPSFRMHQARERGVDKKLLIECWGGLGDIVCAEPAIRFAKKEFDGFEISVETWFPQLFQHIGLTKIYDTAKERAKKDQYFIFKSMYTTETLSWEFARYAVMQRVDYCSMAAFGRQIPVSERCIKFVPSREDFAIAATCVKEKSVVVHPGRTWASRTMPKDWWDAVLSLLIAKGIRPVIIGAEWTDGKRGTVMVNPEGCLDIRGKLSLMETVAALQIAPVVLTNDSAPLHIATSGGAWIGFLSTANHPDYITHWRNGGEWGWRMKNFAKGGMYEICKMYPNETKALSLNDVEDSVMRSWLPEPKEIVDWAVEKL